MKISLVLSGGGSRGAFHLGVICALQKRNIQIAAISGSSIGAIIGVIIANGIGAKDILNLAKTNEFRKIFKFNYFKNGIFGGFYKFDENAQILHSLIKHQNLQDLQIPVFITCFDYLSAKKVVFSSGNALKIALGSCAIPPIFAPVKYQNYLLCDGGIVDNFPISPLLNLNHKILGVDLHPQKIYSHSPKIQLKRILRANLSPQAQYLSDKCDYLIFDERVDKFKIFSLKNFDEMFELGYENGLKIKI